LNIVFMGTPDFSVPTLQALHDSNHPVLAVVPSPTGPKAGVAS
jgi:methionyl-tRNA formyltransferase